MAGDDFDERLSRISTNWSMLVQAHEGTHDAAELARQRLMERYCGAVYRYLLGALHDPHAAEDLTQEFALRFVRGLFRGANPTRGRFRDYVKTALFHLVDDFRRREARAPRAVPLEGHEPAATDSSAEDADRAFVESWRAELLAKTWAALEAEQEKSGQPYHAILRLRVEQPDLSSPEMAAQVGAQVGRAISPANARQLLHRSREKFAELLLQETATSLGSPEGDRLEEELTELDLLKYCRPVFERRGRRRR